MMLNSGGAGVKNHMKRSGAPDLRASVEAALDHANGVVGRLPKSTPKLKMSEQPHRYSY